MRLYLAKTLDNMKMYGPIPDLSMESEDRVEEIGFGEKVNNWVLDNMLYDINYHSGANLDDGDYDFKELYEYLNNLPEGFVPKEYVDAIDKLKDYTQRAITYNTGIAIEL